MYSRCEILFPHSRVKVFVFLVVILRRITMSALAFLGIWVVIQILSTVHSISVVTEGAGIAWFAHLGGLVFGLLMGFIFRNQAQRMTLSR